MAWMDLIFISFLVLCLLMLIFIVLVFDFLPSDSIIIQDINIRQEAKLDKEVY